MPIPVVEPSFLQQVSDSIGLESLASLLQPPCDCALDDDENAFHDDDDHHDPDHDGDVDSDSGDRDDCQGSLGTLP